MVNAGQNKDRILVDVLDRHPDWEFMDSIIGDPEYDTDRYEYYDSNHDGYSPIDSFVVYLR